MIESFVEINIVMCDLIFGPLVLAVRFQPCLWHIFSQEEEGEKEALKLFKHLLKFAQIESTFFRINYGMRGQQY